MSPLRSTLFMLGCSFCFATTAVAQQSMNYGPAKRVAFQDAIAQIDIPASISVRLNKSPDETRALIWAQVDATFPVFIFIPGVMGSKLTKNDAVIWGHYNAFFQPSLI